MVFGVMLYGAFTLCVALGRLVTKPATARWMWQELTGVLFFEGDEGKRWR